MDLITADWETYYSTEYSLSRMTTEAYVRDPQFEPIGIGIKVNNDRPIWYAGRDFKGFLSQFNWADVAVLCHNTVFDGAIFNWHFGIKPKLWLDTMSMARAKHNVQVGNSLAKLADYYGLGEKGDEVFHAKGKRRADFSAEEIARYGSYCLNDVELTYKLFKVMQKEYPQDELMVIHNTLKMFVEPTLELDVELLKNHLLQEQARKNQLLMSVAGEGTVEEARKRIMSNVKLAELLHSLGVTPPTKISPTTKRETYAFAKTDKAFLALEEHEDPRVATVVSARLGVKSSIEETRTENLLAVASRGSLPVMLNYYGAHTGRFSGGDKMNLQNLPRGVKGDPNSGLLRKSIRAPKGKVLVACDSSQIEARTVAFLAGQMDLVEAFRQKRDIYSEFASDIYGRKIDRKKVEADVGPGFVGKTCILGLGYQMGPQRLQRTLEIGNGYKPVYVTVEEAARYVGLYREKFRKIASLWRKCRLALDEMHAGKRGMIGDWVQYDGASIVLPNGMRIQYPGMSAYKQPYQFDPSYHYIRDQRTWREFIRRTALSEDTSDLNWTYLYGGMLTENFTQAIARIVVSEQMNQIAKYYHVVLQVHDELVICVDENEADTAKAMMQVVMSTPPKWMPDLPVACEAGIGYNYGECK